VCGCVCGYAQRCGESWLLTVAARVQNAVVVQVGQPAGVVYKTEEEVMMQVMEGQQTRNVDILLVRMLWNNGLTLSQAWKRMQIKRPEASVQTLITEWRRLKRLFGCKSLPLPYLYGYIPKPPTEQELSAVVAGNPGKKKKGDVLTYGDWLGVTGPGKRLRDILIATEERYQDAGSKDQSSG